MSKSSNSPTRRQPPVQHQFKAGQSGNPSGRPKGSRNKVTRGSLARIVLEEAEREAPGQKGVSAHRAVVRKLYQNAAKGELASANIILSMAEHAEHVVSELDERADSREEAAAAADRKKAEADEDDALAARIAAEDTDLYLYARTLARTSRLSRARFADVVTEARQRISLDLKPEDQVDPFLMAAALAESEE